MITNLNFGYKCSKGHRQTVHKVLIGVQTTRTCIQKPIKYSLIYSIITFVTYNKVYKQERNHKINENGFRFYGSPICRNNEFDEIIFQES